MKIPTTNHIRPPRAVPCSQSSQRPPLLQAIVSSTRSPIPTSSLSEVEPAPYALQFQLVSLRLLWDADLLEAIKYTGMNSTKDARDERLLILETFAFVSSYKYSINFDLDDTFIVIVSSLLNTVSLPGHMLQWKETGTSTYRVCFRLTIGEALCYRRRSILSRLSRHR